MVISGQRSANCNLKVCGLTGGGAEVVTRDPPERVKAPYVVPRPTGPRAEESSCFVLQL